MRILRASLVVAPLVMALVANELSDGKRLKRELPILGVAAVANGALSRVTGVLEWLAYLAKGVTVVLAAIMMMRWWRSPEPSDGAIDGD